MRESIPTTTAAVRYIVSLLHSAACRHLFSWDAGLTAFREDGIFALAAGGGLPAVFVAPVLSHGCFCAQNSAMGCLVVVNMRPCLSMLPPVTQRAVRAIFCYTVHSCAVQRPVLRCGMLYCSLV